MKQEEVQTIFLGISRSGCRYEGQSERGVLPYEKILPWQSAIRTLVFVLR